jgi:hypothetical protein
LSAYDPANHMGISTFFLLGVLVMHRDIERTLNITIFQELLKITKKKKKKGKRGKFKKLRNIKKPKK